MKNCQEWGYLGEDSLTRKRREIYITCNHFRYSTTNSCVTILTYLSIKSLFLKEIISLRDVDIGEKTGDLPQKLLEIHRTKFIASIIKELTNI